MDQPAASDEQLQPPARQFVPPRAAGSDKPLPRWMASRPWVTFLLPFAVFLLAGSFEPTSPDKPWTFAGWSIEYADYPTVYTVKIALTLVAIGLVWPGYGQFQFRVSPLALAVGVVGVFAWIGLTRLGLEARLWAAVGYPDYGQRSAFNPIEHWPDRILAPGFFLAVRLWGLAIVVPVIEEFFLRGLVMRYVISPDWTRIRIGTLTPAAYAAGTLLPVAMHPAEMLAAAVWFSMVTALTWKTKCIWDAVAAHAVTNLLLGIYVIATGDWQFL